MEVDTEFMNEWCDTANLVYVVTTKETLGKQGKIGQTNSHKHGKALDYVSHYIVANDGIHE